MITREQFCEEWADAKLKLGLSDREMARMFEISRPTVQRYVNGEAAPHPVGREPILQVLRRRMEEKETGVTQLKYERQSPYAPDRIRIERGDWKRVSSLSVCETCGLEYTRHAPVIGYPWLNRICNGDLVKL